MPKAAPAAGAGTPATGNTSNATDLAAPVVEEEGIDTPLGDSSELGSHRDEDTEETETVEETAESEEVAAPARLKGKPLAQVYKEFSGLEKEYSRQGNELGEARALLRHALEQALKHPGAKDGSVEDETSDPTEDEFLTDPKAAAKKLIARELKPLQDAVLSAEQRSAMLEFEKQRPGYTEEVATPQFQEWVKAKPSRLRLFKSASQFDLEAASDLFELWDATKPAADEAESGEKKKAAIKRVTTETGGSGKTIGSKSGKKIYKSTELARLYVQDRDRYNEMAPEIRAAFAEGRVR